jgi:hypothetical protein
MEKRFLCDRSRFRIYRCNCRLRAEARNDRCRRSYLVSGCRNERFRCCCSGRFCRNRLLSYCSFRPPIGRSGTVREMN